MIVCYGNSKWYRLRRSKEAVRITTEKKNISEKTFNQPFNTNNIPPINNQPFNNNLNKKKAHHIKSNKCN